MQWLLLVSALLLSSKLALSWTTTRPIFRPISTTAQISSKFHRQKTRVLTVYSSVTPISAADDQSGALNSADSSSIAPSSTPQPPITITNSITNDVLTPKKDEATKKSSRNLLYRWITGLPLGALATMWVASGNGAFSLGFLVASLIAQNEYYNMVKNTGVIPAFKIGTVASLMCFVTAAMCPQYHELVMPISATLLMIWLLVFNKKSPSINEISTSLLGMFYLGYLPSFWVRLRALEMTIAVAPPSGIIQRHIPLLGWAASWRLGNGWTLGALVTWWTWLSIVAADVSAYFVGKNLGRHKLSSVSLAAGAASPNKTVEGALGGCLGCSLVACLGAYHMRWPRWQLTGAIYGVVLAFIALVGDLTASMMKRDANVKDSGRLFPGHGGILDRMDSYMFTAPLAFFFCDKVLPLVLRWSKRLP